MPATGPSQSATATTPLELLGSTSGLSVVDPMTILTRLWYFDGKFLRAAGFRLDQDYVRSLAALSHQATGSGVVHGFGVTRPPTGDRLRIGAGLALAPSGRVVYLPREVDVSIADLLARSTGSFDPAVAPAPGVADFRRCPPDPAAGPDIAVAARPLYVLTVAGIEALCGEEERFGQLCVDACATETDRSTVVEGVCFRVRELTLALPISTAVPFDGRHLRSRVASAYFQAERAAVPAMISGAGLGAPAWCAGADAIGGEEVPLAVLDRAGEATVLLDIWTARRELQETSPRRYWAARMAMRPWDVFLAQVLQFQCQLLDLGAAGPEPDGPDGPCRTERDALTAADEVLGGLPADAAGRIEAVRATIAAALGSTPGSTTGSGSLLVDGGIVELPPAGYLPTSLSRPVQEQVRALFGPGVDVRFCAVRPDFVPEALQEAQHMERISLTRGLDDPARLEEVDVLVPGGEVVAASAAAAVFTGVARVFPTRPRPEGGEPESALTLSVVARDRSAAGWSWTAVGYGEAPKELSVRDLASAALRALGLAVGNGEPEDEEIPVRPDAEHDRVRRSASFTQRLVAEGRAALGRRAQVDAAAGDRPPIERPAADADRPVAAWLDGETGTGLDRLAVGASTNVRARATTFTQTRDRPVVNDTRLTGAIRVVDVLALADRKIVRTVFDGVAEVITSFDPEPRIMPVRSFALAFELSPQRGTLRVGADDPVSAIASFSETREPHHIAGELVLRRRRPPVVGPVGRDETPAGAEDTESGADSPVGAPARAVAERPAGTIELDEQVDALAPGSSGRALAESVIAMIGAELAAPGRDPAFPVYATERLLGGLTPSGPTAVTATTDWVFFARRRTRTCVGEPSTPVRFRTYRMFHRRESDRGRAVTDELLGLRPRTVRGSELGFDPVATVRFAAGEATLRSSAEELRTSWLAADRGSQILLAAIGDFVDSDGEAVALARLATVRSVLADLADSSNARIEYIPDIPPEFHQPGLDGAMFTIGADPVTCVTVLRLLPDGFKRLVEVLLQVGDSVTLEDAFLRADVSPDVFTVVLVDDQVADPEALRVDWQGLRVLEGVLAVPSATGEPDLATWRMRAGRIGEVIGLGGLNEQRLAAQTGECGAILLVAVEPVIG